MRTCSTCGKRKKVSSFHKDASKPLGIEYCCRECKKKYTRDNIEEIKERSRQDHRINRTARLAKDKQYRVTHRQEIARKAKLRNSKRWRKDLNNQKAREARKTSPLVRLKETLRARLCAALKQTHLSKTQKLSQYLGCTLEELKAHLEKQFTKA